jgi:hypothetical protein
MYPPMWICNKPVVNFYPYYLQKLFISVIYYFISVCPSIFITRWVTRPVTLLITFDLWLVFEESSSNLPNYRSYTREPRNVLLPNFVAVFFVWPKFQVSVLAQGSAKGLRISRLSCIRAGEAMKCFHFRSVSYARSTASSRASSQHSAI